MNGKRMMSRKRIFPILAAFLFVAAVPGYAQKTARQPAGTSKNSGWKWSVPAITRDTLANGLRIVHARVNNLPLVEIDVLVDAGLTRDPDTLNGLALLTGKLLFSGTEKRTREQIFSELAVLGSTISSFTNYEYSQIYLRTLKRNLPQSLEILSDICMNTSIPDGEFRGEKNRLLSSLAAVRSNAGETGTRILLQQLFGMRHVLARAVAGTAGEIERLAVEDAQKFFETYYRPENTTIIVVGDVDFPALKTLVHDRFGRWRKGREKPDEPSRSFPRIDGPRVLVVPDTSARFVQVRYGMRIPTRSDPDFPVVLVLNQLLGGGNDSRLYRTLWGKHIVMPSFYSSIGVFRSGGWLIASGSTPVSRLDSVLYWMGETIESLRRELVGKDELAAAIRALTSDYPLGFTTNKRMHEQLLEIVHFGLEPGELAAFPARLEAVTPEAVLRVAQKVCDPEGIVIVVVGNVGRLLPVLEAKYGLKLQVLPSPVTE